jgi:flagellar motor switch protein FliN
MKLRSQKANPDKPDPGGVIEVSQVAGSAATRREDAPSAERADAPTVRQGGPAPVKAPYRALYSLPVEIVVCVGTARPSLSELMNMGPDALVMLDRRIHDPVDIRVGDRVIARGELQEMDDGSGRLGVRLTEVLGHEGDP